MTRYAIYYCPRPGPFASHAAAWLGWDAATSQAVAHPHLAGLPAPLAALAADPHKYGFHGTIRAPFRPLPHVTSTILAAQVADMAQRLPAVTCAGLQLHDLDGFLALTPVDGDLAVQNLAAAVVEATNDFRAPLTPADIARRKPDTLTARQRTLLDVFGYPFVMEEFQFHLTLTGRLTIGQTAPVTQVAHSYFDPVLPKPFVIEDLCLLQEGQDERFHLLSRHALTG